MHLYREGHRQRSRILYVFRSPGGVRVGRGALDPDVLREIEAQYPDIAFDWKDVREHQQHIEMSPEPRRRKPPKRDEVDAAPSEVQAPVPVPAPTVAPPSPSAPAAPSAGAVPPAIEGATPDDQIAFLGHWYVLIRERIPRRTSDQVRQEALMALCERLNPAAWTDADQIAVGLQQASEALERLSRVFSRRRRRARRRPNDARPASPGPAQSDS
jgi:hypothetical protein